MAESRWSELPGDLVAMIAKRLNTKIDTLRLRAVCQSWRSSVPVFEPKPSCPLTLPFPYFDSPCIDKNRRCDCTLYQNSFYFLLPPPSSETTSSRSQSPWLFRAEELDNGKFSALSPLARIIGPRNISAGDSPKVLNLLDLRILEICRGFNMKIAFSILTEDGFNMQVNKAVVSSHPFTPDGDDYEIAVINGLSKLGFIRLGDEKWSVIEDVEPYDDVVYHKGHFYVVDIKGKMVVIGPDLKPTLVAAPSCDLGGKYKTLLSFGEDLYLIVKHNEAEANTDTDVDIRFKVYELNEKEKTWVRVYTLGDKVFFVGCECSFALSRNSIYFSEDMVFDEDNEELGVLRSGAGVYRLEDRNCLPLASFKSHPLILWPLPAWLQQIGIPNERRGILVFSFSA